MNGAEAKPVERDGAAFTASWKGCGGLALESGPVIAVCGDR